PSVLELLAEADEERDVDRLEADDQGQQIDVETEAEPAREPDRVQQGRDRGEEDVPDLDADGLDRCERLEVVVVPIDLVVCVVVPHGRNPRIAPGWSLASC